MEPDRDQQLHRRTATWAIVVAVPGALAAGAVVIGVVWRLFLHGAIVAGVTDAVAQDLEAKIEGAVEQAIAPLAAGVAASHAGLKVSILGAISQLEDDIAALEYRQARARANPRLIDEWTAEDMQRLTNKRRRLDEQLRALSAIENAERLQRAANQ